MTASLPHAKIKQTFACQVLLDEKQKCMNHIGLFAPAEAAVAVSFSCFYRVFIRVSTVSTVTCNIICLPMKWSTR